MRASGSYTLAANKDYWVLMQTGDDRELATYPYTWTHTSYQTTRSDGQTSEATQGTWSIGDKLRHVVLVAGSTSNLCPGPRCDQAAEVEDWREDRSGHAVRIRVEGDEVNAQTEAPRVTGAPALSEAGTDGTWTPDETVEVTLTWSEAVNVDTTGGTPSIGLTLGGHRGAKRTLSPGSRDDRSGVRLHADRHRRLAQLDAGAGRQPGAQRRHDPERIIGGDAALGHTGATRAETPRRRR